jgi:prepilin-type N-terminal cleavage/methylation domain-containing protein
MLQSKQKGFTLLELLVVITLLAVLSVGALVAYEGVGESAEATAAANNTVTSDRAIRNYRAVTGSYPEQWDNLSEEDTGLAFDGLDETAAVAVENAGDDLLMAREMRDAFGNFNLAASTISGAITDALEDVGLEEFQTLSSVSSVAATGVVPNLQHNEGANPNSDELAIDNIRHISIVPAGTGCTAGGASIATNYTGTVINRLDASRYLNTINDSLETDLCHLVLAVGFGHDAASSTFDSSVAIAAAPTFSSKKINPSKNYARYVALFHVGTDTGGVADDIETNEIRATPRLIGVVAPDGTILDNALANAKAAN